MSSYGAQALAYKETCSEDVLGNIFEPDVMLPSQFFLGDETGVKGGERKLMAALLSDGIEAFIAQATTADLGSQTHADAVEWVQTKDPSYVFSFDVVCECLGINPDYLRMGLNRYVDSIREKRMQEGCAGTVWKRIRRPRK